MSARSPHSGLMFAVAMIAVAFAGLGGCGSNPRTAPDATEIPEPSTTRTGPLRRYVAGWSVTNRPIEAIVMGDGPATLLLIGCIHGDEAAGIPLVERFESWLVEHPEALVGRRVVIVPVVNPDGLASGSRYNHNGVDLNRNFPATNHQPSRRNGPNAFSEPESRVLMLLINEHRPAGVLVIHQPINCIDYDGPAESWAAAIAAACPLPVRKLGARPGSLGAWFGETLGRPIITMELPRRVPIDPETHWQTYGPALIAALEGIDIAASPAPLPRAQYPADSTGRALRIH